jgi:hypothetical protein
MPVLNKLTRITRRPHPELIYEQWGGRTYYRKGYNDVLKNRKTPAEIIGSSGLQAFEKGIDTVEYKDWNQPIEVVPGVFINIGEYLAEEEVGI